MPLAALLMPCPPLVAHVYCIQAPSSQHTSAHSFLAVPHCSILPHLQTVVLGLLMKAFGYKRTITIGLAFQFTQLLIYGLSRDKV